MKKAYTTDGKEIEVNFAKNVELTPSVLMNQDGGDGSVPSLKYDNYVGDEIINGGDKLARQAAIILKAGDVIDLSKLPKELRVRYQDTPIVLQPKYSIHSRSTVVRLD